MPAEVKTIDAGISPEESLKVRDTYVEKWKQLWTIGGGK
jgi:hypothetical protein